MDEEMRTYLDHMMKQINNQFDRMLDLMAAMRQDSDSTKGHVLYGLQDSLTLSQRITKVEEELRRR